MKSTTKQTKSADTNLVADEAVLIVVPPHGSMNVFPTQTATGSIEPALAAAKPRISLRCFYYPDLVRVKNKYTYVIVLRT